LWRSPDGESFDGKPDGLAFHPDDEWFPGILVSVEGNRVTLNCGVNDPRPVLKVLEAAGILAAGILGGPKEAIRYEIRDPDGNLVAVHVRKDSPGGQKQMWWERANGSPGLGGLHPADLLFGVERLRERAGEPVVVVEGEKAALALQQVGILAVGTVCGAAATPSEKVLRHLLNHPVILWPDADEPGCRHMHRIAETLDRLGHRDVRLVVPPEGVRDGWDAADAVAEGLDVRALIAAARPVKPARQGPTLLTAAEVLETTDSPEPDWLVHGLIPAGGMALLVGRPKSGKSTLARALAVAIAQGRPFLGREVRGGPVLLISLEDRQRDVARHLRALGLRPDDPFMLATELTQLGHLRNWVQEHHLVLVVIDTVGRVLRLRDSSEYAEVIAALGGLLRLARDSGVAVFLVHHAPKGSDSRDAVDAPLGSTAFAGTADVILHLKRGQDGIRTLATTQRVGEDLPESVVVLEDGWPELAGTRREVQAAALEQAILNFLRTHGEATKEEIRDAVAGDNRLKDQALVHLLVRGRIVLEGKGVKGDPHRYRIKQGEPPEGEDLAQAVPPDSCFLAEHSTAAGKQERLEPAPVLDEFLLQGLDKISGSAAGIQQESEPPGDRPPGSSEPGSSGGPSDPEGGQENPSGNSNNSNNPVESPTKGHPVKGGGDTVAAPEPGTALKATPGGAGHSADGPPTDDPKGSGPPSRGPSGPEGPGGPVEPPSSRGDTSRYSLTEIETPSARMTTRLPNGTIRLSWDGREEAVAPGDLDGWAPVEEIAHPNLPEVSAEISPTLVLDIETTGLDPTQERILAVGLALYRDGQEEVCEVLRDTDERALLSRTFERVAEVAPRGGVLTGYNLVDFDLFFLYMRSQRLGVKCPFWPQRDGRGEVVVRNVAASAGVISGDPIPYALFKNDLGLQIVDAFHLVARFEFTTRNLGAHKDLKSVAEHFGIAEPDRVVIPHGKIFQATLEELERYVKGDLRETYRVYEHLVRPYLAISRLTKLPLEDVVTRSTAWVWEQLLERHYGRTGKPEEKRDYPGGLVVSRPGLYYPCAKLDVASLYPTIMLAYRIHSRKDTDAYALSWLRSLTEMRLRLKERARGGDSETATVQEGLKILINSLYGFYGTGGYGFNDMDAARRVTELGRKVLVKMIAAIEDAGGVVVEADTDGVIVCAQDPQQVLAAVQQALPQPFHVDVEWTGAIVFASDRKNYIVLDKEGCVVTVKGAKWRGRDKEAIWTRFPREFLRRWIVKGKGAAMEYARWVEEEIASGRGWDWVKRTHRVSASDKYLLEAGFGEDEVATYAYKDKRKRTVGRSPQDGYDAAYYAKMLQNVVRELVEAIGHEEVAASARA
jgi:energy-coupling factor transporter ATP-binding protein EcfA2